MKIPLIWLKDYVKTDKSPREIAASFTQLGLMLDKPLGDGTVLDLEHRMDRSDWLSVIGCARDFAAFENTPLQVPKVPIIKMKQPTSGDRIPITVHCPDVVRRFNTRVFRGVKVGPSPNWLTDRLEQYGIKSINNIVDITNFVMVELGQPMHAQDLAKLPKPEITIRHAKKHEKITSFLGTTLELDESMFVLTSGDKPVVVGGIVGGEATGVTADTTDFILDAGNYDQRVIRSASRKLRIANETVLRYDKFLDPRLTEDALNRATALITDLAGGTCYENQDYYPVVATSKNITLRHTRLKTLSGMDISLKQAKSLLTKIGYVVVADDKDKLTFEIPYFRTDVEVEDDLIADVLRIGDYTNIPSSPLSTPVPVDITPSLYRFEERLRDILVAAGCHEHITGSLVPASGHKGQIVLQNALTSEQSALRMTMSETLKQVTANYAKHGKTTSVFEIGKVFVEKNRAGKYESYTESRELTAISPDHATAMNILATVMNALGIRYRLEQQEETVHIVSGKRVVGRVESQSFTLVTEDCEKLAEPYGSVISNVRQYADLDLSYTVPPKLQYGEIHKVIIDRSPTVTTVTVKERQGNTILLHLEWPEQMDADKEKLAINAGLKKLGIISRSG